MTMPEKADDMADKTVVLVTGAESDLGAVVAQRLAADGYTVAASDIHLTAEETVRSLEATFTTGAISDVTGGGSCDKAGNVKRGFGHRFNGHQDQEETP
jgi:NAD(P)-dependent dehydrogenase (short-subunit alcohol dehydrogenase family)